MYRYRTYTLYSTVHCMCICIVYVYNLQVLQHTEERCRQMLYRQWLSMAQPILKLVVFLVEMRFHKWVFSVEVRFHGLVFELRFHGLVFELRFHGLVFELRFHGLVSFVELRFHENKNVLRQHSGKQKCPETTFGEIKMSWGNIRGNKNVLRQHSGK